MAPNHIINTETEKCSDVMDTGRPSISSTNWKLKWQPVYILDLAHVYVVSFCPTVRLVVHYWSPAAVSRVYKCTWRGII